MGKESLEVKAVVYAEKKSKENKHEARVKFLTKSYITNLN